MTTNSPDAASALSSQSPEVDFTALQPGRTVGRYEIVAVLGHGGFGITYRARDSQLGRDVAVKEYLPSALAVRQDGANVLPRSTRTADDFTWGRQRFVDEGRTLATLQRASAIVRVYDFLEANGTAYIVMELVPGNTLESRLRKGPLGPEEVDRILWPLLDGLEQVHASGFLHRDIKPANILLDAGGNPTLIDFGAARAAIAGHTSAMTAVFTPGYAAAEQMTSAKQGPWTDIYALSATLYHAIAGTAPPSAFDRMLEDTCRPLAALRPEGFAPGLLIGIDSGLAVRATDRPQSIAGWRPILAQAVAPEAVATMLMRREADPPATVVMRSPAAAPPALSAPRRNGGLWIAFAAVILLAIGGGAYHFASKPEGPDPAVAEVERKQRESAEAEASRQKAAQEELVRLRDAEAKRKADDDARLKADAEAAMRRQIEEETRRTLEAEAKSKAEDEARLKAEAEAALRRQADEQARQQAEIEAARQKAAEEEAKRTAEASELALQLTSVDRQHVQIALAALGYSTGTSNGVFGTYTRQVLADWQKSRGYPATGHLTGAQNQMLLREASPAIARFDDDRKKAAEVTARPVVAPPSTVAPPAPQPAAAWAAPAPGSVDGVWQGSYACEAGAGNNGGNTEPFTIALRIGVAGGSGTWTNPGRGTRSVTMQINGATVQFTRMVNLGQTGQAAPVNLTGRLSDMTISAAGHETPFGRRCSVNMVRIGDIGTVPAPTAGSGGGGGGGGGNGRGNRQR